MKTIYEIIWSIIGLMLIAWFVCCYITTCQMAAVSPIPDNTPEHQKQSIREFLEDHPDIKKRVDDLQRQAEHEMKYKQS